MSCPPRKQTGILGARRQKAQDLKALFRRDGMSRRHEVVQLSALGLLILFGGLFAPVT